MAKITATVEAEVVAPGVLEVRVVVAGAVAESRRYYLMLCRRTHTERYYASKAKSRY